MFSKFRIIFIHLSIASFSLVLGGCTKKVSRLSTTDVVDISGRWNDTDARITAEEMISTILDAEWFHEFNNTYNSGSTSVDVDIEQDGILNKKSAMRLPVMVVGDIKNKSSEHIEPDTFIKDIERALINKRSVRIITNSSLREKLRSERSSQQQSGNSTIDYQKKYGRELGADYMMFGTINTIVDASEDDKVIFYQINLELVDLQTGEIVWVGEKKIKKYRSKTGKVRNYQKGGV